VSLCEQGRFERTEKHHSTILCALAQGPTFNSRFTFIAA
jgi:hypothetical protein